MEKQFPQRKPMRLSGYDYKQTGYYFVTICTQVRRENILCAISPGADVGGGLRAAPATALTNIGQAVNDSVLKIPVINPGTGLDVYVVMPDHIHLILNLTGRHGGRPLPDIIKRFKSYTDHYYRTLSSPFGPFLWQRGYYDHIIRNETDLQSIRQYIRNNPLNWFLNQP